MSLMRRPLMNDIKKHFVIAVAMSAAVALAWKHFVSDWRKEKYQTFYKYTSYTIERKNNNFFVFVVVVVNDIKLFKIKDLGQRSSLQAHGCSWRLSVGQSRIAADSTMARRLRAGGRQGDCCLSEEVNGVRQVAALSDFLLFFDYYLNIINIY